MTEEHSYIYAGGMLLRETITSGSTTKTLDFRYDNVGHPYALIYNNGSSTATYYYITNLQGDVMYLVDSNGNQVAAYTYDPYGKILSAYGSMAEINPLRYRGYYYDAETGFYYLQSRLPMTPTPAGLSMQIAMQAQARATWATICLPTVGTTRWSGQMPTANFGTSFLMLFQSLPAS